MNIWLIFGYDRCQHVCVSLSDFDDYISQAIYDYDYEYPDVLSVVEFS